ncbi:aldo/keto reductase [Streptomyces sp. IBSNAI001]|uniref:aldo/keto reductase n=1 Tax=Streptomyces sp. IBSNAI001 TaxID=3457499 RepID=UPI003FD3AC0D
MRLRIFRALHDLWPPDRTARLRVRARDRELRHRLGRGRQPDEARRILDRFAEDGGTFLDCAGSYQFGESEELTGKLISADRDHFVLATKFALGAAPQPDISKTGNSCKTMVASVEASLKRLGTDYIDLLWVHFPDRSRRWRNSCAYSTTW